MKIQFRLVLFALLPVLGGLAAVLPRLLWEAKPWSAEAYSLVQKQDSSGKIQPASWFFLQRKSNAFRWYTSVDNLDAEKGRVLYIGTPPEFPLSDEDALSMADEIKAGAQGYSLTVMDRSAFPEGIHPLYQKTLEQFLGVAFTGWSIRYYRDTGEGGEVPEAPGYDLSNGPLLVFKHQDGEVLLLKAGEDFSGLPPLAESAGRKAPVFQWVPIYIPVDDSVSVPCSLQPGWTEEGKLLCLQKGIPLEIPLLVKQNDSVAKTLFYTVNIEEKALNPQQYRRVWKEEFKERFSLFRPGSMDAFFWRIYLPTLARQIDVSPAAAEAPDIEPWTFVARDGGFYQIHTSFERPFYIQGVNLGPAVPGRWFTQFPQDEKLYYRWFSEMKEYHLNSLRIYTLLPPAFYRALAGYNLDHPEDPLFLIQEIWPEEHPPQMDYLLESYNREFHNEIAHTLDALYGRGEINPREGRAWGRYHSDVSPWLMALLIGRELEPEEVLETNRRNPGFNYTGRWISAPLGPATEAWLAWACDYAASYELEHFNRQTPVGIVSWPTLDPLHHPTEWLDPLWGDKAPFHDKAEVDINRILIAEDYSAGLFGAYHIYPNYPDFMNNQESYGKWSDEEGSFRYGGYLQEFLARHSRYPALVAEYGLSNSQSTAHFNPEGYHHGGLTVVEQARGIQRMTNAIQSQGYAGGLIFEWIDEWAKKTWTTEALMIPYDRQALWHNALDPEQNYGLMAMEARGRYGQIETEEEGYRIGIWGSESHLYFEIQGENLSALDENDLMLGLDVYDRNRGNHYLPVPDSPYISRGLEWIARIDPSGEESRMLASEGVNWGDYRFHSSSGEEAWEPVHLLVNRAWVDQKGMFQDSRRTEAGKLYHGSFNDIHNTVLYEKNRMLIRIPWGLLGVSDPSSAQVLDDPALFRDMPSEQDQIRTSSSKEIGLFLFIKKEEEIIQIPSSIHGWVYQWTPWNVPQYEQTPKESLLELKDFLADIQHF